MEYILSSAAQVDLDATDAHVRPQVESILNAIAGSPQSHTHHYALGRRIYVHPDPMDGGKLVITFLFGKAYPKTKFLEVVIYYVAVNQGVH